MVHAPLPGVCLFRFWRLMMRQKVLLLLLPLVSLFGGCAAMLNPYDEEFSCPYTDKGACQSATQAYETSLQENSGSGAPKASGGSKLVSRKKPTFASPFGPSSASARILGLEP